MHTHTHTFIRCVPTQYTREADGRLKAEVNSHCCPRIHHEMSGCGCEGGGVWGGPLDCTVVWGEGLAAVIHHTICMYIRYG